MLKCPKCKEPTEYILADALARAELTENEKLEWVVDSTNVMYFCPMCDYEIEADNPHDAVLAFTEGGADNEGQTS